MKKVFVLFICLFSSVTLFAQPVIEWQKTIGGTLADELTVLKQTSDGGFILGGASNSDSSGNKTENSNGLDDYWVVKLDSNRNIQWQNTIGGNSFDDLFTLDQTVDGGYILGGLSLSDSSGDRIEPTMGGSDYWVIKIDSVGNIQWQNAIGGNGDDELHSIHQTSDGGYILGGWSNSNISGDKSENSKGVTDCWIVKLDGSGTIQWQKTIGGSSFDILTDLEKTYDGGFIVGAYSESNISGDKTENSIAGSEDYWVFKLDSNGTIQWQNTIGGNNIDELKSISQTSDGGYIIGGFSLSGISGDKTEASRGLQDYWVLKLDPNGNIQWQKTLGGSQNDFFSSVTQTFDGGFIASGYSTSDSSGDKTENSKGLEDYWIVKINSLGNIQWQKTIGGNGDDELRSIQLTNDGGCLLGGSSLSNISGDKTENRIGLSDYWILKLSSVTSIREYDLSDRFELYPNPVIDYLTININSFRQYKLSVINSIGNNYLSLEGQSELLTLDVKELPAGIYFIRITDVSGKIANARFMKLN